MFEMCAVKSRSTLQAHISKTEAMALERERAVTAAVRLPGWQVGHNYRRRTLVEHANALYVMQLSHTGEIVGEPQFTPRDLQRWWAEMFGTFRAPAQDAWYTIHEHMHGCERLSGVLFHAWGYAEALRTEAFTDPRRKQFFPADLPNITELVTEGPGDRCEICMCEWGDGCQPESPLLHDWRTACTHWACRQCWLSLAKSCCPWCGWDIYEFLFELNADIVQPSNLQPQVSTFYIGDPYEDLGFLAVIPDAHHVGWLHDTGKHDIEVHFERDVESGGGEEAALFVCRINGHPVALYNGFRRDESLLRTWHVICRIPAVDAVLSLLACLFPRVSKSRVFQFDTHW
jgi:hypothetical protein